MLTLPVHPFLLHPDGTLVHALGIGRHGEPIWPVRGAADPPEDDDKGEDDKDESDDDDDQDDEVTEEERKALADPGKQALDRISAKHKTERDRRKQLEQEIVTLKAANGDGKKADAPDADEIRKQVRAEVDAEVEAERTRDRVMDKIEAKAARLFADPDDAAALLLRGANVDDFLDANGKLDAEAIEDGLNALLKKKPYLGVAQGDDKKRFKGSGDGGARKEQQAKPKTLEEAVARRIRAGSRS